MRDELGDRRQDDRRQDDREGRPYILCKVQMPFFSRRTHLWSYEEQVFRRVIKAGDANMLVTGTDCLLSTLGANQTCQSQSDQNDKPVGGVDPERLNL
jgi:hypothetical protein